MESADNMPTAADYAWSAAQGAERAAEGNREERLKLENRVIVLEGEVAFLAKLVQNMQYSLAPAAPEDLDTLDRIVHYKVKE